MSASQRLLNILNITCVYDPRRRKWQLSPVFLPGESHGQRRLVGYGPWGGKELDMTEATEHACIFLESLPLSDLSRKNTVLQE